MNVLLWKSEVFVSLFSVNRLILFQAYLEAHMKPSLVLCCFLLQLLEGDLTASGKLDGAQPTAQPVV